MTFSSIAVIIAFLKASMVFMYAGLGELFNQRSGVLNVGIEGIMLFGAWASFAGAQTTGNPWIGVLAAIMGGAIFGLLHVFLSVTLQVDQVVAGMGVWIFCMGITTYLGDPFTGSLSSEGQMEPIFMGLTPLFFIGIILPFVLWFVLYRTGFGLKIRSTGENPAAVEASGVSVTGIRYIVVIIGGILVGMSGAYLTLVYSSVWSPNVTMGRGWITLALVIFALRRPFFLMGGALLFGFLWHVALRAGYLFPFLPEIPYQFWRMLPFIITVVVLVITSFDKIKKIIGETEPAALGEPYIRED